MYIRTKKIARTRHVVVQLAESFRYKGKTKQHVLRHIGTAHSDEELKALKQVAQSIKIQLEHEKLKKEKNITPSHYAQQLGQVKPLDKNSVVDLIYLEEEARHILGIHDVYGYVYEQLGFANPFSRPRQREKSAKILREIVLARIANPQSKRASVEQLHAQFGVTLNLDHVYQMMDKIDEIFCERIQKYALAATLQLTGEKLRVLFYDATTLYFESFTEDEFKQNGYSKDMKFNQPQILLAIFVTDKGLPVGYEIFPGKTFEGHTLVPVLNSLKKKYDIKDVIFVADRGMLSKENLQYLQENNFKYIVGARLRGMSAARKKQILDSVNYSREKDNDDLRVAKFEINNTQKLIVSHSKRRAYKDSQDREKAIQKLRIKLYKNKDPKSLIANFGYKKYLIISNDSKISVNEQKIIDDAKWDGLHGIITNITNLNTLEVLNHYNGLWQVEESFRINKHDLKIRPIYHWTPQRIKAHIAISFMAFVCVRYLEYRVATQSKKLSPQVIRDALMRVQASVIRDQKSENIYLLPSKINSEAKEVYRVVGITAPKSIMTLKM